MRRILTGLLAALTAVAMLVVPGSTPAPAEAVAAMQQMRAARAARPAALPTGRPLRAMALGDSLAMGIGSSDGMGWRPEVTRLAALGGVQVVWTNGSAARAGATVQDLRAGIDGWIAADLPDLIVLVIGTNNAAGTPPGMAGFDAAFRDLVARIFALKPDVVLYQATIPYSSAPWSKSEVDVNITSILTARLYPGRAFLVTMELIPPCGWMYDGIHFRDAGYRAVARQIYRAFKRSATAHPVFAPLPAIPPDAWLDTGNPEVAGIPRPGYERDLVVRCNA